MAYEIPWTQAPQNRLLTSVDVYKPMGAGELMQMAAFGGEQQMRQYQLKVLQMQAADKEREIQDQTSYRQAILDRANKRGQSNPLASPGQTATPPELAEAAPSGRQFGPQDLLYPRQTGTANTLAMPTIVPSAAQLIDPGQFRSRVPAPSPETSSASTAPVPPASPQYRDYWEAKAAMDEEERLSKRFSDFAGDISKIGVSAYGTMKPVFDRIYPEFAGVDPSKLAVNKGIISYTMPSGEQVHFAASPDGKHWSQVTSQEGKSEATDQIVKGALAEKLGRNPTKQELAAGMFEYNKNNAKMRIELKGGAGGKPPSGYRYTATGDLEPIPGGPADLKQQPAYGQAYGRLTDLQSSMSRLEEAAKALKDHKGVGRITGAMSKVPNMPGSDAANAQALLENLKSQSGFAVLQNMRDLSKTGGALGQVSGSEDKMLQANLAALDQSQSTEEFKKNLDKIITYAQGASKRMQAAFDRNYGERKEASSTQDKGGAEKDQKRNANFGAAVDYIKASKGREDAIKRAQSLKARGWSKEDINAIGAQAGY